MELDMIATAIRAIGSIAGAALALIFQPPINVRDFVIRSAFSSISGLMFGEGVRVQYLKWPDTPDMMMGSAAIVALGSWWIWGAAVRVIGKFEIKK